MQEKTYTISGQGASIEFSTIMQGEAYTFWASNFDELVELLYPYCPSGRLSDLQGVAA